MFRVLGLDQFISSVKRVTNRAHVPMNFSCDSNLYSVEKKVVFVVRDLARKRIDLTLFFTTV